MFPGGKRDFPIKLTSRLLEIGIYFFTCIICKRPGTTREKGSQGGEPWKPQQKIGFLQSNGLRERGAGCGTREEWKGEGSAPRCHCHALLGREKQFCAACLGSSMGEQKPRLGGTHRQLQTRANNTRTEEPGKGKAGNFNPFSCPLFSVLLA